MTIIIFSWFLVFIVPNLQYHLQTGQGRIQCGALDILVFPIKNILVLFMHDMLASLTTSVPQYMMSANAKVTDSGYAQRVFTKSTPKMGLVFIISQVHSNILFEFPVVK